jgi:adenosylcobyric acid synthase
LGICGGYQMMGEWILDPEHVESPEAETSGLGLLPTVTTFVAEKRTVQVRGKLDMAKGPFAAAAGEEISAYEIHMGATAHRAEPLFQLDEVSGSASTGQLLDGCCVSDGLFMGSYLHGLFENPCLRRSLVRWLADRRGLDLPDESGMVATREREYDRLADCLRDSLDMEKLFDIVGLGRRG